VSIDYKELDDLDLFIHIKKFDPKAIEEIYNRYAVSVLTLIKKILQENEKSENAVIEVFAIIWKKSDRFHIKFGNPFVWIMMLSRNVAVDILRRERDKENKIPAYDEHYENDYIIPVLDPDIDQLDLKSAMSLLPKIKHAWEKLTDAQKYVITLAYFEGLTIDEISKKLNIPVETVRNKVRTVMSSLRDNVMEAV